MTGYTAEYALGEFQRHGEVWLQSHLSGKLKTIFDVGSNVGEWTRMAREYNPNAEIHTFEVMAPTYRKMLDNITIDNKIYPNSFGLGDENGPVIMKYKPDYDAVSTSVLDLRLDDSWIKTGLVMRGDDYVASREIDTIDFLKVDTEGAEEKVFKGFEDCLKRGKIKMIQFEYGYICVLTKWLLKDSYVYLGDFGYSLGKLTPQGIQFHDYALYHEDFQGPDYVAVHNSYRQELGF